MAETSTDGSSVTLVGTATDVVVAVFVLVLENDLKSPSENDALASHIQDLRHRNKERAMSN